MLERDEKKRETRRRGKMEIVFFIGPKISSVAASFSAMRSCV